MGRRTEQGYGGAIVTLECQGPHKCLQTVDSLNMMLDSEVEAYRRLSAENAALRAQRDELAEALRRLSHEAKGARRAVAHGASLSAVFDSVYDSISVAIVDADAALAKLEVKP